MKIEDAAVDPAADLLRPAAGSEAAVGVVEAVGDRGGVGAVGLVAAFDHQHPEPAVGKPPGGGRAAHAGADDDDIPGCGPDFGQGGAHEGLPVCCMAVLGWGARLLRAWAARVDPDL